MRARWAIRKSLVYQGLSVERVTGIEPALSAWEIDQRALQCTSRSAEFVATVTAGLRARHLEVSLQLPPTAGVVACSRHARDALATRLRRGELRIGTGLVLARRGAKVNDLCFGR